MLRAIASIVLSATLAACTSNQTGPRERFYRSLAPQANPTAVVATELAFARAAQEKGQWTAFREFAAKDAVMFVPEPVNARVWLKKQSDPAQTVRWQPYEVWSSCDGTLAVTRGAWQRPDGTFGYFTTVWERQRNDAYKWVMDQGDTLAEPLEALEMIGAQVADCGGSPFPPVILSGPSDTVHKGAADDGTLHWSVTVSPNGSRAVLVSYWDGSGWQRAVREQVSAQ